MDSVNPFDAAVIGIMIVAIIMGFQSGLLRALATILGYVCAAPVAIAVSPTVTQMLTVQLHQSVQQWAVFAGLFVIIGILLAALTRMTVGALTGERIGIADRMGGAMLGAVRIILLAVVMVLIFDRIIPPGREPAFLVDSKLRPILSAAGQQGLQSLPPDVTDYIDRVKRERGL